jgi:hypothetical protein
LAGAFVARSTIGSAHLTKHILLSDPEAFYSGQELRTWCEHSTAAFRGHNIQVMVNDTEVFVSLSQHHEVHFWSRHYIQKVWEGFPKHWAFVSAGFPQDLIAEWEVDCIILWV